jgi:hypothetical protein
MPIRSSSPRGPEAVRFGHLACHTAANQGRGGGRACNRIAHLSRDQAELRLKGTKPA